MKRKNDRPVRTVSVLLNERDVLALERVNGGEPLEGDDAEAAILDLITRYANDHGVAREISCH